MRDVLRVIGGHEKARRVALDRYKASGCSLDSWRPQERRAMADALSYAEDALELERGSGATQTRAAIREMRKELESAK